MLEREYRWKKEHLLELTEQDLFRSYCLINVNVLNKATALSLKPESVILFAFYQTRNLSGWFKM